jgi:WD40 repeat protein
VRDWKGGEAPGLSPSGKYVVLSGDKDDAPQVPLVIIDLTNPKAEPTRLSIEHTISYPPLTNDRFMFSPDGRWLFAVGEKPPNQAPATGNVLSVVDLAARRVAEVPVGTSDAALAGFSPDGRTLAVWVLGRSVVLYDTTTWQVRGTLPFAQGPVEWSPDGRLLASQMPDGRLAIWNLNKLAPPPEKR